MITRDHQMRCNHPAGSLAPLLSILRHMQVLCLLLFSTASYPCGSPSVQYSPTGDHAATYQMTGTISVPSAACIGDGVQCDITPNDPGDMWRYTSGSDQSWHSCGGSASFGYLWTDNIARPPNWSSTAKTPTWLAPGNPGQYIITCTIKDTDTCLPSGVTNPPNSGCRQDSDTPISATINVIGGDYTATNNGLRYYCGAYVPYAHRETLTAAPNQPPGTTWSWTVTSGPGIIESGQGTSSCVLAATLGSTSEDDIHVQLTYSNSGHSCSWTSQHFTARVPSSLEGPAYEDTITYDSSQFPPVPWGYVTHAVYYVYDQFGRPMDDNYVGETFGNVWVIDYFPMSNWGAPAAGGGHWGDHFYDTMAAGGSYQWIPPAGSGSSAVAHHTQYIWLGSSACDGSGCQLKTHSQQYYQDRGRHE